MAHSSAPVWPCRRCIAFVRLSSFSCTSCRRSFLRKGMLKLTSLLSNSTAKKAGSERSKGFSGLSLRFLLAGSMGAKPLVVGIWAMPSFCSRLMKLAMSMSRSGRPCWPMSILVVQQAA